ncbi:unnamed protein product, partial [Iphiclides podalirius]
MPFVNSSATNITEILSNLFGEMLLASEPENSSNVDVSQYLSAIKEHSSKGNPENFDFGTLIKLVDGWRNKLNLTKTVEARACNYCEGSFRELVLAYNGIHGYVSLIVCFFGSLANALNVAVLTRRDLAAAPINRLLKWLAVADVFVMVEYVPFAVYRYLVFDIHMAVVLETWGPMILYHVDSDHEGQLYQINFWIHAVVIKLLPCCILTGISLWLIREVNSANRHQRKIRVYTSCVTNKAGRRHNKADKRANRTTKMLIAVLVLFLVTELPQGILGLLSGLLGRCFFKGCYDLFGELMDALALLNGAINFILYCSMSRQFRMTFRQLVWRTHLHKWPPPTVSHSDGLNTAKSSIP